MQSKSAPLALAPSSSSLIVTQIAHLTKPFDGKKKVVKEFRVYKEEESVLRRYQRVRGVGTVQLDDRLHIVTRSMLQVPPKKFLEYGGSTAGSMIGPVVMPSQVWEMTWEEKKKLYGPTNLVPVGGKLPAEQDALAPQQETRTNATKEPALFHSYPV